MTNAQEGSGENSGEGPIRSEDSDSPGTSTPPAPPESPRRLRLRPIHGAFLLVLLLITGLAVAGFFGNVRETAGAQSEDTRVFVDYPERFRFKEIAPLRVWVQNRSPQPVDTLSIRFDSSYVEPFSNVSFLPSATEPWVVHLKDVKPGETRRVQVHLQAEQYGSHSGQLHAFTESDTASAPLSTFVFP